TPSPSSTPTKTHPACCGLICGRSTSIDENTVTSGSTDMDSSGEKAEAAASLSRRVAGAEKGGRDCVNRPWLWGSRHGPLRWLWWSCSVEQRKRRTSYG